MRAALINIQPSAAFTRPSEDAGWHFWFLYAQAHWFWRRALGKLKLARMVKIWGIAGATRAA
jgi:hypothetical protein